jgi:ABC-type protease/lipase transport system fused ATPase/permease subunit
VIGVTNKLLLLQGGTAYRFGPTAKVLTDLTTAAQKHSPLASPGAAHAAPAATNAPATHKLASNETRTNGTGRA